MVGGSRLPSLRQSEVGRLRRKSAARCAEAQRSVQSGPSNSLSRLSKDPELTLGYGLFYFPQSFLRIQFPLVEILERGWNPPVDRPIRILDLGAGVGAAGFGAVSLLQPRPVEGWALDHSEEALRIHEELSAAGPLGHWHQSQIDLHHPQTRGLPRMDLILVSFTLTEMTTEFAGTLDLWLRALHPKGHCWCWSLSANRATTGSSNFATVSLLKGSIT